MTTALPKKLRRKPEEKMRLKSFLAVLLALAMSASMSACGAKDQWQEQYDLGKKYLDSGNYQEAVVAFKAAITIDSKRAEAYISLADAYTGQNDYKDAADALRQGYAATGDKSLSDKLDELNKQAEKSEDEITDINGNTARRNYFNPDGSLAQYQLYTYDAGGRCTRSDNYDGDGTYTGYVVYNDYIDMPDGNREQVSECYSADGTLQSKNASVQSKDGKWLYSGSVDASGTVQPSSVAQYDKKGNCTGWNNYSDGKLTGYARYENGQTVYYNADGTKTMYMDGN